MFIPTIDCTDEVLELFSSALLDKNQDAKNKLDDLFATATTGIDIEIADILDELDEE